MSDKDPIVLHINAAIAEIEKLQRSDRACADYAFALLALQQGRLWYRTGTARMGLGGK